LTLVRFRLVAVGQISESSVGGRRNLPLRVRSLVLLLGPGIRSEPYAVGAIGARRELAPILRRRFRQLAFAAEVILIDVMVDDAAPQLEHSVRRARNQWLPHLELDAIGLLWDRPERQ
jgi:hypothetical protein